MGAKGHLFFDLSRRALRPLRMKKSYQRGPLIVQKRTLSYRGLPERIARFSERVKGPLRLVKADEAGEKVL